MAEVGNMGLPPKVLRKGITDMVRISDARMSGTAYGTVCLHTSPEAAAGGPLAVVRNGDFIELDVPNRRLHLDVSDKELADRLAKWKPSHVTANLATPGYISNTFKAQIQVQTWIFSRDAEATRSARIAIDEDRDCGNRKDRT